MGPPMKRFILKRFKKERVSLPGIGKHPNRPQGARSRAALYPVPDNPIDRWLANYSGLTTRCPLPTNAAEARESRMRVEDLIHVYGEERAVALLEEVCGGSPRPVTAKQAVYFCQKKAEVSESPESGIAPGARRASVEYQAEWEKP